MTITAVLTSCGGGGSDGKAVVNSKHWTKTFTGQAGLAVQQTSDGGSIVLAETADGQYLHLMKTDVDGNIMWTKVFDGFAGPALYGGYGNILRQTGDGGYIFAGSKKACTDVWFSDIQLVKTDDSGNLVWEKCIGGSEDDVAHSIIQTTDLGYAVVGSTGRFGSRVNTQIYFSKTDSAGNVQWTQSFDNAAINEGIEVKQTRDGGYVIAGTIANYDDEGYILNLIKTNAVGDAEWTRFFNKAEDVLAMGVEETENGYTVLGKIRSYVGLETFERGYSMNTDINGNTLSEMFFGGGAGVEVRSVLPIDSGFVVMGYKEFGETLQADIWLERINLNGATAWLKTLGGSGPEWGSAIQQTDDEGFIIAGGTNVFDMYLVKTDKNGNI